MDIATFGDCLDRYGGDLALWPAAERDAATALAADCGQARALLAAMADVEAVLHRGRDPSDEIAVDRIVARATRHRQETRPRLVATRVGWGALVAAVLALGVLIGGMSQPFDSSSPDRVVAAAFDAGGAADVD